MGFRRILINFNFGFKLLYKTKRSKPNRQNVQKQTVCKYLLARSWLLERMGHVVPGEEVYDNQQHAQTHNQHAQTHSPSFQQAGAGHGAGNGNGNRRQHFAKTTPHNFVQLPRLVPGPQHGGSLPPVAERQVSVLSDRDRELVRASFGYGAYHSRGGAAGADHGQPGAHHAGGAGHAHVSSGSLFRENVEFPRWSEDLARDLELVSASQQSNNHPNMLDVASSSSNELASGSSNDAPSATSAASSAAGAASANSNNNNLTTNANPNTGGGLNPPHHNESTMSLRGTLNNSGMPLESMCF